MKLSNIIIGIIIILGLVLGIVYTTTINRPIVTPTPNIDSVLKPYKDSICILDSINDTLEAKIIKLDGTKIKTIIKYETIIKNLDNFNNDALDSIIFMEPR